MTIPQPTSASDPTNAAIRVLQHLRMGAICPAETWSQLADAVSAANVRYVLDSLPTDLQAGLRQLYADRPLSFDVLRGNPVSEQVEDWCQRATRRRE